MCLRCLLKVALLSAQAAEQENRTAEAEPEATAAYVPEPSPGYAQSPVEFELDAAHLARIKSEVALNNATTVEKLISAEFNLRELGRNVLADGVLRQLDEILNPAQEINMATEQVEPAAETPADDLAGMPPELVEMVKALRASGAEVELVRFPKTSL